MLRPWEERDGDRARCSVSPARDCRKKGTPTITTTTNIKSVSNQVALVNDQKMISGVGKYFAGLKSLAPAGNATTPAKLEAIFQDDIDQTQALDTLLGQVAEQRAKQKAARALAIRTRADVKAYILGNYGQGNSVATMLNDFGYGTPKKKSVPTTEAKAAAVKQAAATKAARGPIGKHNRAKVKGVVAPAADATPAAAPAAPATPATPTATK